MSSIDFSRPSPRDFSRPSPRDAYYDVFLSFRGTDTRKGFTTNLYHALQQHEIHTFMDEDLMGERIEQLFEVIAKSRMAVIIYSERFASSDWCLKELETILQRQEDKKMLITPIFYKVDVHELKKLNGKTGEYLDEHLAKYDKGIVDLWKVAVRKLGGVSGISYKEIENRSEYEFIKNAIARISKKLKTVCQPIQQRSIKSWQVKKQVAKHENEANEESSEGSSRDQATGNATRENTRTIFYEAKVLDPNRITSRGFSYIGEVKPFTGETTSKVPRTNVVVTNNNYPTQLGPASKNAWVMKIYVTALFSPDLILLQVNPGTTLSNIKAQVNKILGLKITVDQQHLYYNGEELKDNRNLASYKIPNESVLFTFKE